MLQQKVQEQKDKQAQNFKLNSGYTFWVQQLERGNVQNLENYRSNLRAVTTVMRAQQFWQVFQYLKKSNDLPKGCDLYIFKEGVKPQWEDQGNVGGGCFKIKIDKKKSNKVWQLAVLTMISPQNKFANVINGIRIKIKQKFDEIQIWLSSAANKKENMEGVKNYLKDNLQISDERVYIFLPFK